MDLSDGDNENTRSTPKRVRQETDKDKENPVPEKNVIVAPTHNDNTNQPSTSGVQARRLAAIPISTYCRKPLGISKRQAIDKQLLKFIATDYQPFNIVDSKKFQKFVAMLNPSYQMPNKKTLSNSLLAASYDKCLEKVKMEITEAKFVAITTDGWTSINNEGFYAITAHFLNSNVEFKSRMISHLNSQGNILQTLQRILLNN